MTKTTRNDRSSKPSCPEPVNDFETVTIAIY